MSKIETQLKETIKAILKDRYDQDVEDVMIEIPKDSNNGDYATNIAMRLTKVLKNNPRIIAQEICEELNKRLDIIDRVEIAGPGFINFWIKKTELANVINTVIDQGDRYGHNESGKVSRS